MDLAVLNTGGLGAKAVRTTLRRSPVYSVNRDRAAAALHDGLSYYDTYQAIKPGLFVASLIGAAASGFGLYKRGHVGPEQKTLYGTGLVVSLVMAWITRPFLTGGPDIPPDASPEAKRSYQLLGWVDQRAAELRAKDPNFADQVFGRVVSMPGIRESFEKADPLVQAIVV